VIYHIKESIKNFLKALTSKAADKNWKSNLEIQIILCFDDYNRALILHERKISLHTWKDILHLIPEEFRTLKIKSMQFIHKGAFDEAVLAFEVKDFNDTMYYLSCCNQIREEMVIVIKTDSKYQEYIQTITIEVMHQQCMLNTAITICRAEQLFDEAINGEVEMDIEKLWLIIDTYREAINLIRGKELEYEGIALVKIAEIFKDCFKNNDKAKFYYRAALNLGIAIGAALTKEWYSNAHQMVQKYQLEAAKEETEKSRRDKQTILDKIKPQLDAIKSRMSNPEDLVSYIYQNHPPKSGQLTKSTTPKEMLKKAIVHYHPDKYGGDKDMKVFVEEIVKILNEIYEEYK